MIQPTLVYKLEDDTTDLLSLLTPAEITAFETSLAAGRLPDSLTLNDMAQTPWWMRGGRNDGQEDGVGDDGGVKKDDMVEEGMPEPSGKLVKGVSLLIRSLPQSGISRHSNNSSSSHSSQISPSPTSPQPNPKLYFNLIDFLFAYALAWRHTDGKLYSVSSPSSSSSSLSPQTTMTIPWSRGAETMWGVSRALQETGFWYEDVRDVIMHVGMRAMQVS